MISCDSVMVSHGQWLWSAVNWPHHDHVQSMVIMNVKWHHSHFIVNRCQRQWWPHMINHDWGNCLWWPSKTTSFSTERVVAILPTFMMDNGIQQVEVQTLPVMSISLEKSCSQLVVNHEMAMVPFNVHDHNTVNLLRCPHYRYTARSWSVIPWLWCHLTFTIRHRQSSPLSPLEVHCQIVVSHSVAVVPFNVHDQTLSILSTVPGKGSLPVHGRSCPRPLAKVHSQFVVDLIHFPCTLIAKSKSWIHDHWGFAVTGNQFSSCQFAAKPTVSLLNLDFLGVTNFALFKTYISP